MPWQECIGASERRDFVTFAGRAGANIRALCRQFKIRLGFRGVHGRADHPQTQGKVERLHRTIAAEVLRCRVPPDLASAPRRFDAFRTRDNHERPHEALDHAVPASRYAPSPRAFPETLPEIEYGPDGLVHTVRSQGAIVFRDRSHVIGRGLIGLPVAVRPTWTGWALSGRPLRAAGRHARPANPRGGVPSVRAHP